MSITESHIDVNTVNPTVNDFTAQTNQYAMLFKCYLDRSYYSGRGKIINVTKAGITDQYDALPNVYSALWDSNLQCKPAFYAVANVGMNFASALVTAKNAKRINYSAAISAADALTSARNILMTAINDLVVTDIIDINTTTKSLKLSQNYPNPFNPSTVINYRLSESDNVKLKIYDALGREIKTLVNSFENAGEHSIVWDATDETNMPVSSGMYFYRLETNIMNLQKKILLVR
jgi:hypothetical protein